MPLPTSPSSPGPSTGFGETLLASFLLGVVCAAVVVWLQNYLHRPEDSYALRLSDYFSIGAQSSNKSTPRFSVLAVKEFMSPHAYIAAEPGMDEYDFSQIAYYEASDGEHLLMAVRNPGWPGWHNIDVYDWNHKLVAEIDVEDGGARELKIVNPSDRVVALGTQDATTGTIKFRLLEGIPIATIVYRPTVQQWSVAVENPSRVPNPVFALIAAYKAFDAQFAAGARSK